MNVLIFVITMIMLLSLLTYARLETFFSTQIFQVVFNNYMEKCERGCLSGQANRLYNEIKVSKKAGSNSPKVPATSRLSLHLLLNKDERESHASEWGQRKILLKNLLHHLYGDQPFFKSLFKDRPFF